MWLADGNLYGFEGRNDYYQRWYLVLYAGDENMGIDI